MNITYFNYIHGSKTTIRIKLWCHNDFLLQADKSTIVDAAVKHIKNLQQTLEKLEKEKEKRLKSVSSFGSESSIINSHWHPYESREAIIADQGSSNYNFPSNAIVTSNPSNAFSTPPPQVAFQTWSSQNVVLNICGGEAQFCICATKKPGLMTTIAFVLEKHRIDVISANIVCNGNGNFYMILAHVSFKLPPLFYHFLYSIIYFQNRKLFDMLLKCVKINGLNTFIIRR